MGIFSRGDRDKPEVPAGDVGFDPLPEAYAQHGSHDALDGDIDGVGDDHDEGVEAPVMAPAAEPTVERAPEPEAAPVVVEAPQASAAAVDPSVSETVVLTASESLAQPAFEPAAAVPVEVAAGATAAGSGAAAVAAAGDDASAEGEAPRKSRFFSRGKTPSEPKAPKPPKPPKPPKAEKAPRPEKPKKVREPKVKGGVEEMSLPLKVFLDFYQGVFKEREAEQIARAWIEKNFDAPNASYLYLQRWHDGMAVEMQEGGGTAYLPEVLAKLDEDPDSVVVVSMSNRVAQVRIDPDSRSIDTLLLMENQSPPEGAFAALPTRKMKPFDRRGSRVFVTGVALLGASTLALLFALFGFFVDTSTWARPYLVQTEVKNLPSAQMDKVKTTLAESDCVYKLQFAGGTWTIVPGYDNAGTCGPDRPPAAPALPLDGVPADPTLPQTGVAPGTQPAPGAAVVPQPGVAPGAAPGAVVPPQAGVQPPVGAPVPAPGQ